MERDFVLMTRQEQQIRLHTIGHQCSKSLNVAMKLELEAGR